jgi:glycosyltransferase 2 family protein
LTEERREGRGFVRVWLDRAGLEGVALEPKTKTRLKWLARGLVLVLVAWGLSRHFTRLTDDLDWSRVSFDLPSLLLGALLYAGGMSLAGVFYGLVLRDMGARVGLLEGMRVWWVSQVGKYVPGKMMVVIIRCGLLRDRGVSRTTAAIAAFYETPALMAAAAVLASVLFALLPPERVPERRSFLLASVVFAVVITACISPPVYRRLSGLLARPFRSGDQTPPSPTARSFVLAPVLLLPAWGMIGASLIACAHGLSREPIPLELWPLLMGAAAVGVVAGFVVVVSPSGIGVREWVLVEALAPALGAERALAAALALRLLWLLVEVLGGLACYGGMNAWRGRKR